jgi:hypothetical protein
VAAAIVNRRLVKGWRVSSIDETLDRCATTEGYLELVGVGDQKKVDRRGALSKIYENKTEMNRAWARRNPDKVKDKFAKRLDRYTEDYAVFCAQFKERYPQQEPVSFSRFWKTDIRVTWLADPDATFERTRFLAAELKQSKLSAYEKHMGRTTREYKENQHKQYK